MKARVNRSRKFLTTKVGFDLFRKVLIIPKQSRDYLFTYTSGNIFYFPFIKDEL